MNSWSYVSVPVYKLATLHQSATAFSFAGDASASNVGVVQVG